MTGRSSTAPRCEPSAIQKTLPILLPARSSATPREIPLGCSWPSRMPGSYTRPWLKARSYRSSTSSIRRAISCASSTAWASPGAIDAGGGFQNYPEDYEVIRKLSEGGQLTIRLAYNLFTQKPKGEKADFLNWTKTSKYKQGDDYFRHNGAGEMLVFSAADFED